MAEKIIRLFLAWHQQAGEKRGFSLRTGLVFIGFLAVFGSLTTLLESSPIIGWPLCYLSVSALPFILGLHWRLPVMSEDDRAYLRREHGPFIYVVRIVLFSAFFGGMQTLAEKGSWVDFRQNIGISCCYLFVMVALTIYLPFFVGRAIARRYGISDDIAEGTEP